MTRCLQAQARGRLSNIPRHGHTSVQARLKKADPVPRPGSKLCHARRPAKPSFSGEAGRDRTARPPAVADLLLLYRCSGSVLSQNRYKCLPHDHAMASEPEADPYAFAPAADTAAAMAPITAADPAPAAAPPVATTVPMMSVAMRDLLRLDRIVAFENGGVRLVELIQNSVAAGDSGHRLGGPGQACECDRPRNAKHSSKK